MEAWTRTPESAMNWLEENFLFHSYLYYVLDTSIISDDKYDSICKELVRLMNFIEPKHHITKRLDGSGSGFYIAESQYPPSVRSRAFRHIANKKGVNPQDLYDTWIKTGSL